MTLTAKTMIFFDKKSRKVTEYWLIITLLILTRIGDGVTTYFVTPDLKGEKNPLVTFLGFEWIGLFITGTLLVVFISYLGIFMLFILLKFLLIWI